MTPSATAPYRILLVDDEPVVLNSLRTLLQFDGHHVEVAEGGAEALVLLQHTPFHLVITDYEMPGMKGDKLAAAIKAISPLQPVLLVTAYGEQLRSPGNPLPAVDAILPKPFLVAELRSAVANLAVNAISVAKAQPTGIAAPPRSST